MILVSGAAGYIGSHFLRSYLKAAQKDKVLAVDNLSTGHIESLPEDQRVIFEQADIGDFERIKKLLEKHEVSAVVHFAASCYVGESEQLPFKYFNNNILQSMRLFEAMAAAGVKKLVFSSTCAIYGSPQFLPLTEDHPKAPISVYGRTKHTVENLLFDLNRTAGFSFVALRYFNAAGADPDGQIGESHDPETHLIPNVLKVLNGKSELLEIYGDDYDTADGTCIRDYVHVNDLALAHISALKYLEKQECALGINLGTGKGASVREIVEIARQVSGKELRTKVLPRRPGDPPRLLADYALARDLLGWSPAHDLASLIESAWNWEQNRRY